MRFLVDQCLAVEVAIGLAAAGHDAAHASTYDLSRADDVDVLARAAEELVDSEGRPLYRMLMLPERIKAGAMRPIGSTDRSAVAQ